MIQALFDVENPGRSLESLCSFIPEGKLRDLLIADIRQLSLQYCELLGKPLIPSQDSIMQGVGQDSYIPRTIHCTVLTSVLNYDCNLESVKDVISLCRGHLVCL